LRHTNGFLDLMDQPSATLRGDQDRPCAAMIVDATLKMGVLIDDLPGR
jgi:hypothetical protein